MPVENIVSSAPHERGRTNATCKLVGGAVALERAARVHRGDHVLNIDKRVVAFESADGLRACQGKIDGGERIHIYERDGIDAGTPVEGVVPAEADQQVVAGAAAQRVVASIPDQRVAEGGADDILDPYQRVRPATAGRLRTAQPEIDEYGRRRVVIGRSVATDAADQRVVAVPSRKHVIAGAPVESVVATEAAKRVVAAPSIEVILSRRSGQAVVVVATGEERRDRHRDVGKLQRLDPRYVGYIQRRRESVGLRRGIVSDGVGGAVLGQDGRVVARAAVIIIVTAEPDECVVAGATLERVVPLDAPPAARGADERVVEG